MFFIYFYSLYFFHLLNNSVTGQIFLSFTVRDGDEVTLLCENLIKNQDKCDMSTWIFTASGNTAAVQLIKLGQIGKSEASFSV